MHPFSRSVALLNRVAVALSGAALMVMIALITIGVILRKFFNAPIIGGDEIAAYLMVVVTFMGLAYTLKEGGHITVDILTSRLKPGTLAYLRFIWCLVGLGYGLLISYRSWSLALGSYQMGSFSISPPFLPLFPVQLFVAVGFSLFLFQLMVETIISIDSLRGAGKASVVPR